MPSYDLNAPCFRSPVPGPFNKTVLVKHKPLVQGERIELNATGTQAKALRTLSSRRSIAPSLLPYRDHRPGAIPSGSLHAGPIEGYFIEIIAHVRDTMIPDKFVKQIHA